ncbi:Tetratricopeptide repeat 1 [Dillenia turbinata]|uniref:Tetratricopeptide repeat 1 n=1 Tax=Dillenia turbinata TaxID=194707 RepID=A0AAN8VUF3_9MAGN
MVADILLQIVLFLIVVIFFLAIHDIPQKALAKLRRRSRVNIQARRHFVAGAQLLAQARSAKSRSSVASFAKSAVEEADKAILLDPTDAASHILKSLALDLQGFKSSALDSLDAALSPLAAKSLGDPERADALFKRAELRIAVNRRGGADTAIEDLVEAVRLSKDHVKAWCLLGECYEMKKMKEEAKKAYEEAIAVEPELKVAREALDRLGLTL